MDKRMPRSQRLVLGIDAAWTATEPSGVALTTEDGGGWRLLAVESSYERFRGRAEGRVPDAPPRGETPDVASLLSACRRLAGRKPDLVAVDMPLSLEPIVGRRVSDRAISSAFGARKAATHSPSAVRPGALSDTLRADFAQRGFALCTAAGVVTPGLMEVYPHAALLALSGDAVRLAYKAGKTTIYWPREAALSRRTLLLAVWRRIVGMLDREISGVSAALPPPSDEMRGRALKAYEDQLDAVVCAYAAIAAIEGRGEAYGDDVSAVWVPLPRIVSRTAAFG
jgi:predicted RNase H-like nuclease